MSKNNVDAEIFTIELFGETEAKIAKALGIDPDNLIGSVLAVVTDEGYSLVAREVDKRTEAHQTNAGTVTLVVVYYHQEKVIYKQWCDGEIKAFRRPVYGNETPCGQEIHIGLNEKQQERARKHILSVVGAAMKAARDVFGCY